MTKFKEFHFNPAMFSSLNASADLFQINMDVLMVKKMQKVGTVMPFIEEVSEDTQPRSFKATYLGFSVIDREHGIAKYFFLKEGADYANEARKLSEGLGENICAN